MSIDTEAAMGIARANARDLINFARRNGLVITITLDPRKPLAMGHYDMVVGVRPARVMAVKEGGAA